MQNTTKYKNFLGIDVSKDKLDIFNSSTGEYVQIKNTLMDIKKYIKTQNPEPELLVVIDLTGGYEQKAADLFYQAGFCVHRAEGRRVKYFMRGYGQKAKTDRIDAYHLALYGEKMQETLLLYTPTDRTLLDLANRLNELKLMCQQEHNRVLMPNLNSRFRKEIQAHINYLEKHIESIEDELEEIIMADEVLKKKYEIITSIKGVAKFNAITLITYLPELGTLNRRQITALAGVAPFPKDSGTLSDHRFVRYGRPIVKKALFMAAIVASQHDPKIRAFYTHLLQDSAKKKMIALTACMRKILLILNARLKENLSF